MENRDFLNASEIISRNFDLMPFVATNQEEWVRIKFLLFQRVEHLLQNDFSTLYQSLYRIDVSEDKLRKAFDQSTSVNKIAEDISDLILERVLQKLAFRTHHAAQKQYC